MSVGLGLLKCLIYDQAQIGLLDEKGVGRNSFFGEEVGVYDYIRKHFVQFGHLPELETVEQETGIQFPQFPDESIDYWIAGVEDRRQSGVVMDFSKRMQAAVSSGSIEEARRLARDLYLQTSLAKSGGQILQVQALARSVLDRHDRLQFTTGMSGIPFGIEYLDAVSAGAQPSDTIALVGRPSVGKTYFMIKMCLNCFAVGQTPLFVTMEMSAQQIVRRMLALRSNVMATMLRLGRLSFWARRKIADDVDWLKDSLRPFPIMQGTLVTTVEDLPLRVQEIRPSALYVDGAYLLRSRARTGSRWERVAETAEWLKMIANDFNIPVIASYQFNRKGPGSLANIGGSDTVGQLASIVIGIKDEDDSDEDDVSGGRFLSPRSFKILDLLKGREGERGRIRVVYDMQRMIIEQDSVIDGWVVDAERSEVRR